MKLNVSLGQISVTQSDPEANLARVRSLADEAGRRRSHLLCLPEMWTTGFNWPWNSENAAGQQQIIEEIRQIARDSQIWINGSVLSTNEAGRPANTSLLIDPDGIIRGTYRKTHLFGPFQEQLHIAAGDCLATADLYGTTVGFSVCYDLRFPELFRSYALMGAGIILLPAAFPQPRREHWRILLRARAIENQCFVIATNQVGSETFADESSATYFGTSCIIDPWGKTVIEGSEKSEMLMTAEIDTDEVTLVREKFNVIADRQPGVYRL